MKLPYNFDLTIPVTIRHCVETDLPKMEWFGSLRRFRHLFRDTYIQHKRGDIVMLVADAGDFPVGQVWVDLLTFQADQTGAFWALRVLEPFRNHDIGTRLIHAAEALITQAGLCYVELGVETDNLNARRLYERLGYQVVNQSPVSWSYITPEGDKCTVNSEEWLMRKDLKAG